MDEALWLVVRTKESISKRPVTLRQELSHGCSIHRQELLINKCYVNIYVTLQRSAYIYGTRANT